MTVENISWSLFRKECCRPRRGLNPRPPGLQSDGASNWATEAGTCWYEPLFYAYALTGIFMAQLDRLIWAFVVRICDTIHFPMARLGKVIWACVFRIWDNGQFLIAQLGRLFWVFVVRICDTGHFQTAWLGRLICAFAFYDNGHYLKARLHRLIWAFVFRICNKHNKRTLSYGTAG